VKAMMQQAQRQAHQSLNHIQGQMSPGEDSPVLDNAKLNNNTLDKSNGSGTLLNNGPMSSPSMKNQAMLRMQQAQLRLQMQNTSQKLQSSTLNFKSPTNRQLNYNRRAGSSDDEEED